MNNIKVFCIILCTLFFFSIVSCNQSSKKVLPVYNPSDFDPVLVDRSLRDINENHKVSDFSLINQSGDIITQKVYENKIYVVDFFFTRCQTICPIMTNNMAKIQKEFMNDSDVMLLSLSVTPDIDSVSVLQKYARDKGVISSKWNITTGEKKHIYNLARKSYFAVVEQGDGDLQDFIHTSNFILVDKEKQIRGRYDGTDDEELKRIIQDIKVLMN
jgi:protein SCO1/2